jgi:hypothetical protein
VPNLHIERILLVAGAPNTGKSTQLRSMFADPRFGTLGRLPTTPKIVETYALSSARRLYLRLTSPHEVGENLSEFIDKIITKTVSGRWCVASAIQVDATNNMPAVADVVAALLQHLSPERIRVAFLSPDRHAVGLASIQVVDSLWRMPECEVLFIDARNRVANGLLLADTFDFT